MEVVIALVGVGLVLGWIIWDWRKRPSSPPVRRASEAQPREPSFEALPDSEYDYRLEYRDDDSEEYGRGYVVVRNEDGQRLMWQSLPRSEGLRSINVVGERYHMEELQSPGFSPGSRLSLVREPDNPHDPNAVAVRDREEGQQAGYLPRDEAGIVAKMLDRGDALECYAIWEVEREGQRASLRVLIIAKDASVQIPHRGS